jgi:galactokinase
MTTLSDLETRATDAFRQLFDTEPTVLARAPGRVELLGNHTDYNGGLVMASAIDRYTVVAGRAVAGDQCRVRSLQFEGDAAFSIRAEGLADRGEEGSWPRYVRGVVWAMQEVYGPLKSGFDAVLVGNVPLGAGLSSSASLQASVALFLIGAGLVPGLESLGPPSTDAEARMKLAKTLRKSENEYVGVASGLLDQFSSLFGEADRALSLDCRSLEHASAPLGEPAPAIVICDSKTSRRLADGMYNIRRAEGERVVAALPRNAEGDPVTWLRDLSLGEVESAWEGLDPVGRLRARHVLSENERVVAGRMALARGDATTLGRLMTASHASSRDDFENSSPALDALIEAAQASPGFLGGKLSGAGWAGATVNLVEAGKADAFAAAVLEGYRARTGTEGEAHVCRAAEGASASRRS